MTNVRLFCQTLLVTQQDFVFLSNNVLQHLDSFHEQIAAGSSDVDKMFTIGCWCLTQRLVTLNVVYVECSRNGP